MLQLALASPRQLLLALSLVKQLMPDIVIDGTSDPQTAVWLNATTGMYVKTVSGVGKCASTNLTSMELLATSQCRSTAAAAAFRLLLRNATTLDWPDLSHGSTCQHVEDVSGQQAQEPKQAPPHLLVSQLAPSLRAWALQSMGPLHERNELAMEGAPSGLVSAWAHGMRINNCRETNFNIL